MPIERDDELRDVLELDTVAVVGCSSTPGKDAHEIPKYLRNHGYDVIPVNPFADEIFGREAADSLADVDEEIDIVDVFRPSEEVPDIVDAVLERDDVDTVWLQLGIRDDEAAKRAEDAGKRVVQDRCMKVEHGRLRA
ncbi:MULTISPECIES: CoA-binding protein [unclassified Haladaptatus]|uniref:CoA-binding protein n=1 Tax=unclassified Haladaptatus TaxID=2622732 RepID=UPI00209C5A4B|nr:MULTISPECIES: CoA-binding protein [unclassified Haladaptatus]MCO8245940.1 CoA-binding protein [Haladaptatus sp. AB643]MCO8254440.1 CoA-binding protein [Haladaptatus sp. AB618]